MLQGGTVISAKFEAVDFGSHKTMIRLHGQVQRGKHSEDKFSTFNLKRELSIGFYIYLVDQENVESMCALLKSSFTMNQTE